MKDFMEITHLGHSCFRLRGKQATIITDPFNPEMVGIKLSPLQADGVTISHQHEDHNYLQAVSEAPVVMQGPGEYEVKGVRIIGVQTYHDQEKGAIRGKNIVYRIEMDNLVIVHCGDLGQQPTDSETEILSDPDILMVPAGGFYTLEVGDVSKLISALSPKIVIPMHYLTPKMNQDKFKELKGVDVFLKEMSKEGIVPLPKLVVTKDKLPTELTVVVLE